MAEVRQSSFALLGDLTKACFLHVKPHIGTDYYYYYLVGECRVFPSSFFHADFGRESESRPHLGV